ncbi:MAG: hypothetical protein JXQ65_03825 [Candidatus Marinimicrobia bacterium]|nr:hypothetical protein [Candidatus Neomarinimicrobiota bacterium]
MKTLKLFAILTLIATSLLTAKNITMDDFTGNKPTAESINQANGLYARCLDNWRGHRADTIMMILIKQKILFPQCDYEMLLKPLEKIGKQTDDPKLKAYAVTTYLVLVSDLGITIDLDYLYNQNTDEFFAFVHRQMPKMMVASVVNQ